MKRLNCLGMMMFLISITSTVHADIARPVTQPNAATGPKVVIELTDNDTPTVITVPRNLLSNPAAPSADAGRSLLPTAIAGIALTMAMTFGGLHLVSRKRLINPRITLLVVVGAMVLSAGAVFGDAAFPQGQRGFSRGPVAARRPVQPIMQPASGPVQIQIAEPGQEVHIVLPRRLATDLMLGGPAPAQ